ncbi:MAG: transposase [Phenylobacterium sp.]|nr:transposase [Phenylobacterium sp.]
MLTDLRRLHPEHHGRYGSPRMHAALRAEGRTASRGRVARPPAAMGDPEEVRRDLFVDIKGYYNRRRIHSALGCRTPETGQATHGLNPRPRYRGRIAQLRSTTNSRLCRPLG